MTMKHKLKHLSRKLKRDIEGKTKGILAPALPDRNPGKHSWGIQASPAGGVVAGASREVVRQMTQSSAP